MPNQEESTDGLVIKIPTSLLSRHDDKRKDGQDETHDYDFFLRANIVPIQVRRNSEHGTTHVQSLSFQADDQRGKVLELLDAPGLYSRLPALTDYIYELGCDDDHEKRYFAALALSQLAIIQPFPDLKEAAILPWARDNNPDIRSSAAVALSQLVEQENNQQAVLALLKHWVGLENPLLTDCALSTLALISGSYPDEALRAIESILRASRSTHYAEIIDLFGTIHDASPSHAMRQLYNWLLPVTESDLCQMAGILFLAWADLDDAGEDEDLQKKVAEMVSVLWNDPRMPSHAAMQEGVTILMEIWANEMLGKMNNSELPQAPTSPLVFFYDLYERCEGRRNRLKFYLGKWEEDKERRRQREQARNNRKGNNIATGSEATFSYLDLLPKPSSVD